MKDQAIQDLFPEKWSYCFGCGTLNEHGLKVKSYWDGNVGTCTFFPHEYHKAFEGFVYGGLIASVIDCHSIAIAVAAYYQTDKKVKGDNFMNEASYGFVTSKLTVKYLRPAPIGKNLDFKSEVSELTENIAKIITILSVDGNECAKGEVTAIKVPLSFENI